MQVIRRIQVIGAEVETRAASEDRAAWVGTGEETREGKVSLDGVSPEVT